MPNLRRESANSRLVGGNENNSRVISLIICTTYRHASVVDCDVNKTNHKVKDRERQNSHCSTSLTVSFSDLLL